MRTLSLVAPAVLAALAGLYVPDATADGGNLGQWFESVFRLPDRKGDASGAPPIAATRELPVDSPAPPAGPVQRLGPEQLKALTRLVELARKEKAAELVQGTSEVIVGLRRLRAAKDSPDGWPVILGREVNGKLFPFVELFRVEFTIHADGRIEPLAKKIKPGSRKQIVIEDFQCLLDGELQFWLAQYVHDGVSNRSSTRCTNIL